MPRQAGEQQHPPPLKQQLQRDPDNPALLVRYGDLLFDQRDYTGALTSYFKATARAPDNPVVLENIGRCLAEQSLHHEACRYFQAAYDLGKPMARVIDALVLSLRECDRHKEAARLVGKYENEPKLSEQLSALVAIKYFTSGDYEKALSVVSRALETNGNHAGCQGIAETIKARQEYGEKVAQDTRPRVALHMLKAFHLAIMQPIFDMLKQHFHVILTDDQFWVQEFNPAVVLVADSQAPSMRAALPDAKFVYTRHGLISKNFVYDTARTCDYVCVTSETQRDEFIDSGGFSADQIWLTGYAQMDNLFNDADTASDSRLRTGRKMVLYAPTFTDRFSSVPMLLPVWDDEFHSALGDVDLVIKPHPIIKTRRKNWYEHLQRLAQRHENIHLVENVDTDISPYLRRADVLVSDASSVMFQYLAMDRPVIGINNPKRFGGRWFDPNGIEWRWRDMMEQIDDVTELPEILKTCLNDPARKADIRAKYRNTLFGSMTDGQTGQRILAYLQKLLNGDGVGNDKA